MFSADALKKILEAGGVAFRQTSVSYVFTCPRCQKAQKLWMYKASGYFRCYVCAETQNFKGRAEFALAALLGNSPKSYQGALYGGDAPLAEFDLELKDHWGEEEVFEDIQEDIEGVEWTPAAHPILSPKGERGLEYLVSRGLSPDVCGRYDIHYSMQDNRVLFPFYVGSELVGWQGRLCGPTERVDPATGRRWNIPKALTDIQPGIQGNYLMFGNNVLKSSHCVLTEGPISALKADLCGGGVASLGKGVTSRQVRWIAERVKKLYVALDPDAAEDVARVIRDAGSMDVETYLLPPPPGCGDLGDGSPEAVLEEFHKAPKLGGGHVILNVGGRFIY